METRQALTIDSLDGFRLTGDGRYLVVDAKSHDSVALHCSVMHEMLAALANAISWSERIRKKERASKFAMECAGWEVAIDADCADSLVLSFLLRGGAELSFRLRRGSAEQMNEVLGVATGQSLPTPGSTPLQ